MTNRIVPWHAPPWRTLGLLAAAVLLAHALVLQTQPARFGPAPPPPSQGVSVLTTRSIAAPVLAADSMPPAMAGAPASPTATPAAKQVNPLASKLKNPSAQAAPNLTAIESIADPIQQSASPDAPPAPVDLDNAPSAPSPPAAESTRDAGSASAMEVAAPASAAAATPPQPVQTPVTAMALPASAQLAYTMTGSAKGLTYHAKGELLWQNGGDSYNARMTVKALFIGSRTLSSTGQVSAQGLAPRRFSDKSRNEVAAHFEPDMGRISFSANTPPVPWTQGTQDRISVFLQLGGMLAGNPAGFPLGSTISTLTVGPRDADYWTFVVEKEELLDLPFGATAALKLSRQPRRDYDQKVELWYAPALGYLPVRSRITQANGDFVDQQLSELTRP